MESLAEWIRTERLFKHVSQACSGSSDIKVNKGQMIYCKLMSFGRKKGLATLTSR